MLVLCKKYCLKYFCDLPGINHAECALFFYITLAINHGLDIGICNFVSHGFSRA